ncbi:MAG: hypothetical protein ACOC2Q_01170 [Spirochaetota bacterium]
MAYLAARPCRAAGPAARLPHGERAALIASGIRTAAVLAMVVVLYRRLQFASREAEDRRRLAQLGEAAWTLAHEMRSPLTAAQMQTALLRRTTERVEHRRIDGSTKSSGGSGSSPTR